jgi:intracellular sulfur oxidation DsrE/DsrF family protein
MNIVFHLSSGDIADWNHALANVRNLLDDETAETETVALLANGDAVNLFRKRSVLSARVRSLAGEGVTCLACRNSLEGRDIPDSDVLAHVGVVASGVGELTRRQHEGHAYLKVP